MCPHFRFLQVAQLFERVKNPVYGGSRKGKRARNLLESHGLLFRASVNEILQDSKNFPCHTNIVFTTSSLPSSPSYHNEISIRIAVMLCAFSNQPYCKTF